jgi:hypothetical protein
MNVIKLQGKIAKGKEKRGKGHTSEVFPVQ